MFDRPLDCLIAEHELSPDRVVREVCAVRPAQLAVLLESLPPADAAWLRAQGFAAKSGELVKMPGEAGVASAILGLGDAGEGPQGPYAFGGLAMALAGPSEAGEADAATPDHAAGRPVWRLALPVDVAVNDAVLGFCLGAYRFDRLRASKSVPALLAVPAGAESGAAVARATWLARDLINMPANLLGPSELADTAVHTMRAFGAEARIVTGEALARDYPAIEAVGAGSARPPRVVVANWRGSKATDGAPLLSLVGKGVCFDSGGYDIKSSAGMLRMKKDMGGAAIMLALARLVMDHDLPVRLALRLGCVENSISGSAMRPSDVLSTRRGLSVEVGNTDAEGRLVLSDLLAEASDESPDLLVDAATLTGAARVALGPDLPALFSNDDKVAQAIIDAGLTAHDPVWRLPLWDGYNEWLSSPVADLNNVSSRPMAGAIVASLFLQRFVARSVRWAHIDTYAWNDHVRPGRPEGGEALGLRAIFQALLPILNL
ncbi:leucyl aminopeptidase family protein [Lichenicola cladoniae]|uniref:Leucyl aminopeptidase family protein n=1 Tax=Lichenicola cladoniae TaxID=1484109 RepID=A0A6M8HS73_9PROT|nr:leucyl aminopeptidase family protein [Lichenicola cladoniae]NPD65909.1 leucyl aminopeptidase family protein [Acetobacteraceae bacterium]QKE91095.1 leucyl aminopeptidase family protein [Lichenicola cladoniae]